MPTQRWCEMHSCVVCCPILILNPFLAFFRLLSSPLPSSDGWVACRPMNVWNETGDWGKAGAIMKTLTAFQSCDISILEQKGSNWDLPLRPLGANSPVSCLPFSLSLLMVCCPSVSSHGDSPLQRRRPLEFCQASGKHLIQHDPSWGWNSKRGNGHCFSKQDILWIGNDNPAKNKLWWILQRLGAILGHAS